MRPVSRSGPQRVSSTNNLSPTPKVQGGRREAHHAGRCLGRIGRGGPGFFTIRECTRVFGNTPGEAKRVPQRVFTLSHLCRSLT